MVTTFKLMLRGWTWGEGRERAGSVGRAGGAGKGMRRRKQMIWRGGAAHSNLLGQSPSAFLARESPHPLSHSPMRIHAPAALLAASLALAPALAAQAPVHTRIRVTLAGDSTLSHGAPVSGRLLVFMSRTRPAAGQPLVPALDPAEVWIAAREVRGLRPGSSLEVDGDSLAFPQPFSAAGEGPRWVMALLDADHNANWSVLSGGDLRSEVDSLGAGQPLALTLTRRIPDPPFPPTPGNQVVEIPSALLSRFWGHPIVVRATVVSAPDSEAISTPAGGRFRAVYHIPGWGSSHRFGYTYGHRQVEKMRMGGEHGAVHVFLDPRSPNGHVVFANSANDGPWEDALLREVIPWLEARFRLIPEARARYLTGHSSGGWASLWLQVNHPEFFGGAWASSPDPVDFGDFVGVDMRPGTHDNFYRRADGTPHPFLRAEGKMLGSMEQMARQEEVLGPGGQFWSFEAVFGPRGPDGRPARVFDRASGALDPAVVRAWARYDLRRLLESRWATLGPRLRGKLHLLVGGEDTYYLEGPSRRLCDFLSRAGGDASCEIVPGRGHFNLQDPYPTFPNGMEYRFGTEMQRRFDSGR
jgi:hypothetical protein